MNPTCHETVGWLAQQETGVGEVDFVRAARFAAHLSTCESCRALQEQMEGLRASARQVLEYVPDEAAEAAFLEAVELGGEPPELAGMRQLLQHTPSTQAEFRFLAAAQAASPIVEDLSAAEEDRVAETAEVIVLRPSIPWTPLIAVAAALLLAIAWFAVGWQELGTSQSAPQVATQPVASPTPVPGVVSPEVELSEGQRVVDQEAPKSESALRPGRAPGEIVEPAQPAVAAVEPVVEESPKSNPALVESPKQSSGNGALAMSERPRSTARAVGEVRVDGEPFEPREDFSLTAGMDIVTSDASELVVSDIDNAVLTVSPRSRLKVRSWARRATRLMLRSGRIHSDVVHRRPGERYEIVTDNARIVVVGTVFAVTYDPEQSRTLVEGTSGRVRVERLDGEVIGFVNAGETLEVLPPVIPPEAEARRLLAAGDEAGAIALLLAQVDRDWQANAVLADAYEIAGKLDEAERLYQQALRQLETPPESLFEDLVRLQTRMEKAGAGAESRRAYLELYPQGEQAGAYTWWLGEHARTVGQQDTAESYYRALLVQHGTRPEATSALARLGALLISQRQWSEADSLFLRYQHESTLRGETALVGLIRVDLAKGRVETADQRIQTYAARFPEGQRAGEVERLRLALQGARTP